MQAFIYLTTLLFNLLQCQEYLFSVKPVKAFLFYKKHQRIYDELLKLKLLLASGFEGN